MGLCDPVWFIYLFGVKFLFLILFDIFSLVVFHVVVKNFRFCIFLKKKKTKENKVIDHI